MMGLLPRDSVDVFPTKALRNAVFTAGAFTADTFVEVLNKNYFDTLLPREPLYPNNPSHFKIGGLVVDDRLMEPVEFAAYHYYLKEFETEAPHTFYHMTKGRGSVETKLLKRTLMQVDETLNNSLEPIILYPNPVREEIKIIGLSSDEPMEVTNMYGQNFKVEKINNIINIHDLPPGKYILFVNRLSGIIQKGFVKL